MRAPLDTRFQFAILAGQSDQVQELSELFPMEWLSSKQLGESLFQFYKGDSILSSIDLENPRFDLHKLLGIIFVGDIDAFEAIRNRWNSSLPSIGVAFRRIPEYEREAVLCAALECAAEGLASQRHFSGSASLDLAVYRREYERLQRSFSRLEEYVSRQAFQLAAEVFEYPADAATATENSGRTHRADVNGSVDPALIQYLPVDSLGVSGFSIHISAKPEEGKALRIKLKAIETGQTFAAWSIDAAETRIGWVQLALNYAIDEPALSLAMVVEWPRQTTGWALALGPPHPWKEFCARTDAFAYLGAPVALRVFSRLPGVRVPAATGVLRPIDAPHVQAEFLLDEVCAAVVQVAPPVSKEGASLVSYDRAIGCITVHPRANGVMTVARMDVSVPKHAWRVSARIHLAHERASPTQFGLLACAPQDGSQELEQLNQQGVASAAFSGWKRLAPLEDGSVSVLLGPSAEQSLSLYLVTRQAPDASQDFGWARFDRFEFNLLPASIIGGNPADATGPPPRGKGTAMPGTEQDASSA